MAKRKKSRRLGSPPEMHRARAKHWMKNARKVAQDVVRALRHDNCDNALNSLIVANRLQARAVSESIGAGRGKIPGSRALHSLHRKFAAACMKRR